jgi:hypothetical protein
MLPAIPSAVNTGARGSGGGQASTLERDSCGRVARGGEDGREENAVTVDGALPPIPQSDTIGMGRGTRPRSALKNDRQGSSRTDNRVVYEGGGSSRAARETYNYISQIHSDPRPASGSRPAESRPASAMSLGSTGATPRVNPYLQDTRPTTPLLRGSKSTTMALSKTFRAPSPLQLDPVTGIVKISKLPSRPQSATSDDTGFSQSALAQHRKELMSTIAVRLTPLGAVFSEAGQDVYELDSIDASPRLATGYEVYLNQIADDPTAAEVLSLLPLLVQKYKD